MAFNLFDFSQIQKRTLNPTSALLGGVSVIPSKETPIPFAQPKAQVERQVAESLAKSYPVSQDAGGIIPSANAAPIEQSPKEISREQRLFADEKKALTAMRSRGLSDDEAFNQISARRKDLIG